MKVKESTEKTNKRPIIGRTPCSFGHEKRILPNKYIELEKIQEISYSLMKHGTKKNEIVDRIERAKERSEVERYG